MIKFFNIMTEEDKKLLFSDLSGRVLYNPKIRLSFDIHHIDDLGEETIEHQEENSTLIATIHYDDGFIVLNESHNWFDIENVKPYLRPISSMTEEEKNELDLIINKCNKKVFMCPKKERRYNFFDMEQVHFYLSHHFDINGLILKKLAIEAPEDLYKI